MSFPSSLRFARSRSPAAGSAISCGPILKKKKIDSLDYIVNKKKLGFRLSGWGWRLGLGAWGWEIGDFAVEKKGEC